MRARKKTLALLRPKSILVLTLFTAGFAWSQDSFMMHYSPSGFGGSVINRGDFNNDGIPDVVVGNNDGTGGAGLSVLLGIGDGRFQAPKNSAQGLGAWDMAIGDFNGDGKLDVALLAYVSSTQNVVQILLGKGDGTFTKGQTIYLPVNTPGRSITTGDFNNDGKLDLAVGVTQVFLYKGAGNGTFSKESSITIGTQNFIQQVRVGDFNADGKTDIAVSDGDNLYVMWNTGNFGFDTVKIASASNGITATPVDVNQDGFTDLLVTYITCNEGKDVPPGQCTNWKVLLGSANKTFTESAHMNLPSDYQAFGSTTAADFDGDGINDIVGISTYPFPSTLVIWKGNSDGSYQMTPLAFPIGSNSSASDIVAGDFNRDGKIDFAMPTPGTSNTTGLAVFLNATPRATCTPSTESPSVTVCQPQDLIYSNSPVRWVAESRDNSHPVTDMQIYVDNKLVVNSPSNSIIEDLSLSKGPHFIVTKAWDKSGASLRSNRNISIYSGTQGETCPAEPASMNVCLPTPNQDTSTFLHVFANADSSAAQITAVQVYIDNKLIYNDTSGATYVDTAFTVSSGSHSVVVKAFDANGGSYSESRNVNAK